MTFSIIRTIGFIFSLLSDIEIYLHACGIAAAALSCAACWRLLKGSTDL